MDNKTIGNFNPQSMKWERYVQQLKLYLIAYKVEEDVKLATVLTLIGDKTFNLLCDLLAPAKPEEKALADIFNILEHHFSPRPLSRVERFNFRKRLQQEQENVLDYAAELRRLSLYCEFNENLNCALVDQFIFGLSDASIQKRLILESNDIAFDAVIKLAVAAEASNKSTVSLRKYETNFKEASSLEINKIQNKRFDRKLPSAGKKIYKNKSCKHCGSQHADIDCKFKYAICFICKKKGHITNICYFNKSKKIVKPRQEKIYNSSEYQDSENEEEKCELISTNVSVNMLEKGQYPPIIINLKIDNIDIPFELDTGAAVSIMPYATFRKIWLNKKLEPNKIILKAFDHNIKTVGSCKVAVQYNKKTVKDLELIITKEGTSTLLGRAWFEPLSLNNTLIKNINDINKIDKDKANLDTLIKDFEELFSNKLGCISNYEAKLHIKEGAIPAFFKHRVVPFALLPAIETELEKLQEQGILIPTKFSSWAAPIVPIIKKNGNIRICGDYKVGLNKNLIVDQYPLPVIDDLLTKLAGGKIYTKLDLAQAYQQLKMEPESTDYLTINTHKGLFRVTRLPFGIASAPAIFQKMMDKILAGTPNVICYLDDILIASPDIETHLKDLKTLFTTLIRSGIKLNLEKCEFLQDKVEYLGHIISGNGIQPAPNKIKAITEAPIPQNTDQLRSFLGILGYYRKFIPNLSSKIGNLNKLLSKNNTWEWNKTTDTEFKLIKKTITSKQILTHYNPVLPIIVEADASPWGVGAVISHQFTNGDIKPIMFASRTLTPNERNYAQLDKEALGIIFAVRKFHKFIFGRKFCLYTDHKPLTRIFDMNKEIPTLAASRLQRWAIILSTYVYDIKYKPSKDNIIADALSRLPINDTSTETEEIENSAGINHVEDFPWSWEDIAIETDKDKELNKLVSYIKNGWPKNYPTTTSPLKLKMEQLSIQNGCLLWGLRVIIPPSLRYKVLEELHRCHVGIVKMKLLARSVCWWPDMNQQIEQMARTCRKCQIQAKDPPRAPIHPWIRPEGPWNRVHIDLMGPILGKMILVTVDAFSKWPEIKTLKSTTSETILTTLEEYFTRYGYPQQIVTDNGTPFTSNTFETYLKNRGILHTKSAPYHPASNGQAERFVEIVKDYLSKLGRIDPITLQIQLNELLFKYRSTPHATLKLTPAEMFLGRNLRTRLQRLNPLPHTPTTSSFKKKYREGQKVLSRIYAKGQRNKWEEGRIKEVLGPVTFIVTFNDGREGKRHYDQLRPSHLPETQTETIELDQWLHLRHQPENRRPTQVSPTPIALGTPPETPALRYSTRNCRPPDRLQYQPKE